MYLQRCSFNKPSSFNFFANSISPLIKGVFKVLPSIGISSGVEALFRFFEMAAAFALAKALLSLMCSWSSNIKLLSFISSRGLSSRFWFSLTLLLVFSRLWRSSLLELFRLNNKQGWIFRCCLRAKKLMISTFIEPSQDETVSLNRKVKGRCLFWALITATNPH